MQSAASLIYIAWLHVHGGVNNNEDNDDDVDVKNSPLQWLAGEKPDILFDFAAVGMLLGIAKALEWADAAFREQYVSPFSYSCKQIGTLDCTALAFFGTY